MSLLSSILYPAPRLHESRLKNRFNGRWVVVTGASHGIGEALVRRLMHCGANLYLLARSEPELQELCREARAMGCRASYRCVDLRDRLALNSVCSDLAKTLPSVDFLFCNAGKSICRRLVDAADRLHDFDRTMDLNYRSMVALSLTLLPALRRTGGQLVYTSSVSSLYPPAPKWSAYHASKCASNVWCRTAACEWHSLGIGVHVAYLPLVRTPMSQVNPNYHALPAYSAHDAAGILLRLALSKHFAYKPWWAWVTAPVASFLAPFVRFFYQKAAR